MKHGGFAVDHGGIRLGYVGGRGAVVDLGPCRDLNLILAYRLSTRATYVENLKFEMRADLSLSILLTKRH